jgi:hypothetical protein
MIGRCQAPPLPSPHPPPPSPPPFPTNIPEEDDDLYFEEEDGEGNLELAALNVEFRADEEREAAEEDVDDVHASTVVRGD